MNDIKKVAVLCGGDGREREVSLRSGEAVCKALNQAGFNAQTLDLHSLREVDRVKDFDAAFIAMHGDWRRRRITIRTRQTGNSLHRFKT